MLGSLPEMVPEANPAGRLPYKTDQGPGEPMKSPSSMKPDIQRIDAPNMF